MGSPGNKWNVELTKKNVSPTRIAEGSGAKPGIIGLIVDAMTSDKWMISKEKHDGQVYLLVVSPVGGKLTYVEHGMWLAG
jgi:hypothetical protein